MIVLIFLYKNITLNASKIFATQCYFNDHLKHKIVDQILEERPQHIAANYVYSTRRAFQLL